jgi:sulfatase maturation enzyme AslB (radical SAM superfamily)
MRVIHVLRAWKSILAGRAPSLSIEITRECPLRCPGCYAYDPNHLGGGETLRDLNDFKGDALVRGILDVVDRMKPLHLSLVGGDPLVRYRELEIVIPQLIARGIHVQVVTSAFRVLPSSWIRMKGLTVSVSIDGLAPEHDVRRAPATYERILKNIAGHRITVHCTVTAQMAGRPGYLGEFLAFWSARPEVEKIWFSLFTPQRGAVSPECLSSEQRKDVVDELIGLRTRFPKADLPPRLLEQFLRPPHSPSECIFARTTATVSADLRTPITPCQFGGDPDCAQCGCYASMGLAAVGAHKLGGLVPLGSIFHASASIGEMAARLREKPAPQPGLTVISPATVPAHRGARRNVQ